MKYYCSKFTQSAKARYYSAKREDKEHVCDYLNRLNGYARNAGVQFENGGREAKDHVDHFLDTCDDRGLEERLCHARVKDIHDLDEMINDILRSRERKTAHEPSVRRHRGQDDDRRRENRSSEGTRSGFGRERRYRDDGRRRERRDESPYRSRITLVEALADVVTALNIRALDGDHEDSQSARGNGRDATEAGGQLDKSYDADEYSDAESDASEVSADAHGHVDGTNDNERRAAAAGTFARPGNRRQSGGSNQFQRDREGRRQYGPCARGDIGRSEVSIIDATFAGKVGYTSQSQECLGIGENLYVATGRKKIKLTLAGSLVYLYDVWMGDDLPPDYEAILGMDFMVLAGIRLDLGDGSTCLPDEIRVMLHGRRPIFSDRARPVCVGEHHTVGIAGSVELPLRLREVDNEKLWLTTGKSWVTIRIKGSGRLRYLHITNLSNQTLIL
ncbi:hypothetical protein PR001_g26637 [Phytophthora rubi]|nr:hypothetical protein PR001_g26637 [Phytophthora rubi]